MSFQDCLYYLLNARDKREEERDHRRRVIDWMLESDEEDDSAVTTYREQPTAKWRNGKGRMSHISELYVIHPVASQERAIFSGDEYVMNTAMFPYNTEDFLRFCEIMQIQVLTSKDFVTTPVNDREETSRILQTINKKLVHDFTFELNKQNKKPYEFSYGFFVLYWKGCSFCPLFVIFY